MLSVSSSVTYSTADGSGGAVITFSTGATVTLTGISAASISSDWFSVG